MINTDNKDQVFLTRKFPQIAIDMLTKYYHVDIWEGIDPPPAEELIKRSLDCTAILCTLSDQLNQKVLDQLPKLKAISTYAVGYNNIDILECSRRAIKVGNTPEVLTEATADLALTLLMAVSRKIGESAHYIKAGEWTSWHPTALLGQNLRGKTLGIYGMGRIGECFARSCHLAFNMPVIYCNRTERDGVRDWAKLVEFDELLNSSDVISIHAPLTEETKYRFSKKEFKQMKQNSIIINTARGEHIVQDDLIFALKEKTIWGAGLDVTDPEPLPSDHPIFQLKNVVITPHIGSATVKARDDMATIAAQNIIDGLNGNESKTLLN